MSEDEILQNELMQTIKALVEASEYISPDETNITQMHLGKEERVLILRYKGKAFALTAERF